MPSVCQRLVDKARQSVEMHHIVIAGVLGWHCPPEYCWKRCPSVQGVLGSRLGAVVSGFVQSSPAAVCVEQKTIHVCLCRRHLGTVMSSSVCSSQFFVIVGRGHHGCRFYFMRVGLFLFVEWSMPGRWVARMMCWNHCRSYHLVVIPGLWKFGRMHDMPETLNAHLNVLINVMDPGNW